MAKLTDLIHWETHRTDPNPVGEHTVQLESQSLTVRFPRGGYVWHRPTAVLVDDDRRIPIVDVTRITLWLLAGLTVVMPILISILTKTRE